jgi:hypothetical protein
VYEGKTIKIRWRDVSDESLDAAGSALDNVELYALPKPNGSEKNDNADAPYQLSLEQNYPNPFNPVTNITYSLPSPGTVELSLYSVLGERVRSEINEIQSAGIHHHQIKADALSSGIYLCVLRFQMMNLQNLTAVRKITLLK